MGTVKKIVTWLGFIAAVEGALFLEFWIYTVRAGHPLF